MPNGDEQEEEKGLARRLAEEKAKEVLKKAVVEPVKKAVKKAVVSGLKKLLLLLGKGVVAAIGFLFGNPISLVIILSILVIVVIIVALTSGGVKVCLELSQLREQDPVVFEEIKKEYTARGEDIEKICAEAFKKIPGPAAEVYQAKTRQEEVWSTLQGGF